MHCQSFALFSLLTRDGRRARATRDPRPEEGFFRVVFHRDTPLIRSTPDPDRIPRLGPAARRPRRASPSPRTDANRTHRIRSVPRHRARRRPPVARVRIPRNESDALFCFDSGGPAGTRMDDAKSTTVSKRVARVRRVQTAISKSREIHRIRSDPSPSRTSVASSSSTVRPSIHPSQKKSLNENRIRTCALRSNPPVDPPKIGLGVFGLSLGAVHGAGAAAGAAAFSSARTTRAVPREGARRVVARGVVPTRA